MDDIQPLAGAGHPPDEDAALARAAAEDPLAFDAIYVRHRRSVYRYVRSRVATDDEAEEFTAATFERALRSISSFRPRGGGLAAWLVRIARNLVIDDVRRSARRGPVSDTHVDGWAVGVASIDVDHELRILVADLPPRQREVIELRYGAGLTARDIGAVLSISEGAAQKQLERALRALREDYRDA